MVVVVVVVMVVIFTLVVQFVPEGRQGVYGWWWVS